MTNTSVKTNVTFPERQRVLVTGCAGSIGEELVRQLCLSYEVYGIDVNETGFFDLYDELRLKGTPIRGRVGDIRDRQTVRDVFEQFQPDLVYHAAAYKHVTPMEHVPREAAETNVIGLCNIVDEAKRNGVTRFVFISSDKAVNADTVMGATKRLGELIVKNAGYLSVRFGNVLGSRGSVVPIWQKQIEHGGPVTVTDVKMERFFMTIEEAVRLVIEAEHVGRAGEIVVLDMGQRINVLDLAKQIIQKSGKDIDITVTGARPGEQLVEELMTPQEAQRSRKEGKYFVIS